ARLGPHLLDVTMFWSASGGGVARYIRNKRAWLHAHTQWRHTIVVPGASTLDTVGVSAPPLPFSGGYRFPLGRGAAAHAMVRCQPDLIEVGDPYRFAWSALDAGQQLGVPVAAVYHSNLDALTDHKLTRALRPAVRRYLHHLYCQYDAVFAASQWSADTLHSLGLNNVVLQPLGVDCSVFHPRSRDPQWRRELGCTDSEIVLLYAGRFAPEKNLHQLAAAVERLGAPFVFVAIGDGPRPPSGARVRVLPYQKQPAQLARALASADLFVHAGDQETFGLAPLEALACGTPVVMRARAGLTDLIDGRAAIGVEPDGAAALAEMIASVAPNTESLREAARQRALIFDADRAFSRLLNHYTALCLSPRLGGAGPHEERYAA
ncbi:MAG: glycosyltransferase, partial [Burkholderiaceae bacterium]|nr:glycosyltransferase [Burkholderiaceae bacterium]